MRGNEILSGAQRVHDVAFLEQRIREAGVDPVSMKSYLDAFKLGMSPHGGGGIGKRNPFITEIIRPNILLRFGASRHALS